MGGDPGVLRHSVYHPDGVVDKWSREIPFSSKVKGSRKRNEEYRGLGSLLYFDRLVQTETL